MSKILTSVGAMALMTMIGLTSGATTASADPMDRHMMRHDRHMMMHHDRHMMMRHDRHKMMRHMRHHGDM